MNININIHKTLFTQEELYNRSEQLTKWHELIMSSDSKHIGANFKVFWSRNRLFFRVGKIVVIVANKH